jgi:osmotically-inducible protein OsmY
MLQLPSGGWSSARASSTPTGAVVSNDTAPEPSTMTDNSDTTAGSWQQSASEAVRNAKDATQKAYNQMAGTVRDFALEGRIMAVLHENKWTRDSDVQVTANNGIVTLRGKVPSERTADHVQEVVANVYGVTAIRNQMDYPRNRGAVTPPNADSTGVAHPAYSDTAPAENAPAN